MQQSMTMHKTYLDILYNYVHTLHVLQPSFVKIQWKLNIHCVFIH